MRARSEHGLRYNGRNLLVSSRARASKTSSPPPRTVTPQWQSATTPVAKGRAKRTRTPYLRLVHLTNVEAVLVGAVLASASGLVAEHVRQRGGRDARFLGEKLAVYSFALRCARGWLDAAVSEYERRTRNQELYDKARGEALEWLAANPDGGARPDLIDDLRAVTSADDDRSVPLIREYVVLTGGSPPDRSARQPEPPGDDDFKMLAAEAQVAFLNLRLVCSRRAWAAIDGIAHAMRSIDVGVEDPRPQVTSQIRALVHAGRADLGRPERVRHLWSALRTRGR